MFKRRKRNLAWPAVLAGIALAAWMGRALVPEMIRYARLKSM